MNKNSLGQVIRDDLTGMQFNDVVIGSDWERQSNGGTKWPYTCLKCGYKGMVWAETIKDTPDFSCKECRKIRQAAARTTHGMKYTPIYKVHTAIKTRTRNPNHVSWSRYGGRGIKMCSGLSKFEDFYSVIQSLGPKPEGMTIDRKENNGNYSCGQCSECIENKWPFNLRWATDEQQANNRSTNVRIPFEGKNLTFSQWSREKGIDKTTIRKRFKLGWTPEKILSLDGTRKAT